MSLRSFHKSFSAVCCWLFDRFRLEVGTSLLQQWHIFQLFCKIQSAVLADNPLSILLSSYWSFLSLLWFFMAILSSQTENFNAFYLPGILLSLFCFSFPSQQILFHLLCFSFSFFFSQWQEVFYWYTLLSLLRSFFHKLSN